MQGAYPCTHTHTHMHEGRVCLCTFAPSHLLAHRVPHLPSGDPWRLSA